MFIGVHERRCFPSWVRMNLPNPMYEVQEKDMETPDVTSVLGQTDRLGFSCAPRIQGAGCELNRSYSHCPPRLDSEKRAHGNRPPSEERAHAGIPECPLTCHHQLHGITLL